MPVQMEIFPEHKHCIPNSNPYLYVHLASIESTYGYNEYSLEHMTFLWLILTFFKHTEQVGLAWEVTCMGVVLLRVFFFQKFRNLLLSRLLKGKIVFVHVQQYHFICDWEQVIIS